MSTDDVISVRLDSLEESRREQQALNKSISDTLHRIELSLSQSVAKACPLPGHCKILEDAMRTKWEGDKQRFERMEARQSDTDDWCSDIEEKINAKFDAIGKKFDTINKTLWCATGAFAIVMMLAPLISPWLDHLMHAAK